MIDSTDMPTVADLRLIARAGFQEMRGAVPATGRGAMNNLGFAYRELQALARLDVYHQELRRDELLRRGFTPPDDLSAT